MRCLILPQKLKDGTDLFIATESRGEMDEMSPPSPIETNLNDANFFLAIDSLK